MKNRLNAFTYACNFMVELFNREFSFDIMNVKTSILETGGCHEKIINRGQDTQKFRKLVNTKNADIEVRLRDWYAADN